MNTTPTTATTKLREANAHAISRAMKYLATAIGLPPSQMPNDEGIAILIEFTRTQFADLSMVDFKQAVDWMCAGKLTGIDGAMYGAILSPQAVGKMLNAYKTHPERLRLLKLAHTQTTPLLPPVGQSQADAILKTTTLEKFTEYATTKQLTDYGNAAYNYLTRIGSIDYPPEERKRAYDNAIDRLKADTSHRLRHEGDRLKRIELKRFLESDNLHLRAINEAKLLLLQNYFDLCITNQTQPCA